MYRFEISGCLTFLVIFLIVYFIVKELWWLILGVIFLVIVYYYANLIYRTISEKKLKDEQNYNPKSGEVYKVCPYCNTKVKVSTKTCPCCNRAIN